jgi:putative hemolysin
MIDSLPGRVMEVGRTCVDAEFRSGAVIAVLWGALAEIIVSRGFDYLFGCASIGLEDGGANAHAILAQIKDKYAASLDPAAGRRCASGHEAEAAAAAEGLFQPRCQGLR